MRRREDTGPQRRGARCARDQRRRRACRKGSQPCPPGRGSTSARARRAYNGSSPSVIRKQARQNVYQSIERDAARAARRYRRKVGASGSPVLASSQRRCLGWFKEAGSSTTTNRGGPNPSELRAQARRGRLISDAAVATVRAGASTQPHGPPGAAGAWRPLRGLREQDEAAARPAALLGLRRPAVAAPAAAVARYARVRAARDRRGRAAQRRGQTADALPKRSRTPRSRQGSRGSRPSTATVPEDAELPPQQWPFAVFYQRPLTCERVACVDGVDAMPRRPHAVDVASRRCRVASTPSTGEYA